MEKISSLLICIFEVSVFYDFLSAILEKRTEKKGRIVFVIGVMAAALSVVNAFESTQLNLTVLPLILLLGAQILFCSSIKMQVLYTLICWFVLVGMEFASVLVFGVILGGEFVTIKNFSYPFGDFLLIASTKLLTFIVLRVIRQFVNKGQAGTQERFLKWVFLLPVTTVLIYTGLFYTDVEVERGRIVLSVGGLLLLFANLLVFYIMERLASVMEQNREYAMAALQNELKNSHYDKMDEIHRQHTQYIHNLKGYMGTIGSLAQKEQNKEILDLLKVMDVEINSISDKTYTEHRILNALLCEKASLAEKNHVEIRIMVEKGMNLDFIQNGDMIVMVGNLLDNAIEAAMKCEDEKSVDLKFFEPEGNFVVLNIENTYTGELKKWKDAYLSTKKDAKNHGLGLKSVREAAEKYGGLLFMEQKEGRFLSILTLSKAFRG